MDKKTIIFGLSGKFGSTGLISNYPSSIFRTAGLNGIIKPYQVYIRIWSEWRLTVIAATVRIALVDILDLSEVDITAGVFLHPAVGWG